MPSLREAVTSDWNFIMTVLVGVCITLLARFVLDRTIAGMFGVWGISLVGVAVDGYLLLRFWGTYS